MSDVDRSSAELLDEVARAPDLAALETVRVAALGKQGRVTALLKTLGAMSSEQRLAEGPRIQALRQSVTDALATRRAALEAAELDRRLATERLDLTLPADEAPQGSVHPVSQVMDELAEIFADLGFAIAEGPEIEDDWHNFTALNIPETHPARAMHDTFYVEQTRRSRESGNLDELEHGASTQRGSRVRGNDSHDGGASGGRLLLRTHTSPVQIRALVERGAPIRVIAPGRTYRSDSDATHTPMFHQVEGLVVDRGIHLGHLKWTLESFVRAFFEREDVVLRLRPSYFPFTEPSVEVDVGFTWNNGRREIGGAEPDGWMEILGSGMVHPAVLRNVGLDPEEWSGFAFGCGIDRLAMLKYGMTDLRAFFDGDLRWLRHHGFSALQVPTLSGGLSR